MDLLDLDPNDNPLSIRIGLKSAITGGATPGYVSTNAFLLPDDGALRHHAVFLINSSALTPVNSPAPLGTLLQNVAEFRVLDSVAGGSLDGDALTSAFGVDNITATPEPGSLGLLGALLCLPVSPTSWVSANQPGIPRGFSRETQLNFVVPGTAISGTGIGPNSSFAGLRSSTEFNASAHVTILPV